MAEEKKKGKGGFQPGNQLAKGLGRPPLTKEQRAMRLATRTDVSNAMVRYSTLTEAEVDEHLEDPKLPILDKAILKKIKNTFTFGSDQGVDWVLDHIMGMRPKETTVNMNQNTNKLNLNKMTPEQLKKLKEIVEEQEKINDES